MRILAGVIAPTSGRVLVGGMNLAARPRHAPRRYRRSPGRPGRPPSQDPVRQVITAVNHGASTVYRVLADTSPRSDVEPLPPSLQDGYTALLQDHSRRTRLMTARMALPEGATPRLR